MPLGWRSSSWSGFSLSTAPSLLPGSVPLPVACASPPGLLPLLQRWPGCCGRWRSVTHRETGSSRAPLPPELCTRSAHRAHRAGSRAWDDGKCEGKGGAGSRCSQKDGLLALPARPGLLLPSALSCLPGGRTRHYQGHCVTGLLYFCMERLCIALGLPTEGGIQRRQMSLRANTVESPAHPVTRHPTPLT